MAPRVMNKLPCRLCFIVVCIMALLSAPALAQNEPLPSLTVLTEDWPPYQYIDNGEIKGFSVDVLAAVFNQAGFPQQKKDFQMVPWARGINKLNTQKNTVLFLMARTKSRDSRYKWVGPLSHNISYIIARHGNKLDISNKKNLEKYTAGAINGDISEGYLMELGFTDKNISRTVNSDSLALMLYYGRIDLIVDNWPNFQSTVNSASLNIGDFDVIGIANKDDMSYAFSIDTPDWIIERLQAAFNKLVADGTVDAIRRKYRIETEPQP